MRKLYNHTCNIGFTLVSEYSGDQTENISTKDFLRALQARIDRLLTEPEETQGDAFYIESSEVQA